MDGEQFISRKSSTATVLQYHINVSYQSRHDASFFESREPRPTQTTKVLDDQKKNFLKIDTGGWGWGRI